MEFRLQDYVNPNERGLTGAVNRVLEELEDGDKLLLGGGTLHFYKDGTVEKYYCISNNDKGEKKIVFSLKEKKNITIDGEGAELIFHGEILPFVIDQCSGITLKNFSIDYAYPMYVQAKIVNSSKNYFEMQFDGEEFNYRVKDGKIWIYDKENEWEHEFLHCLTIEMDGEKKCPSAYKPEYITETDAEADHGFLNRLFRKFTYQDMGNGRLAVFGDPGFEYQVGNYWIGTFHYNRKNPGIFINDSTDTILENITLYHTLAMGVIAQISENITLKNVHAKPKEGSKRLLSVCADSTHFVNCRGKLGLYGCLFTNMLDDAVNIHGIYHRILQVKDQNKLLCGVGHFQQVGILSYKPGDTISIVNGKTGENRAVYTVKQAEMLNEDEILVEVNEDINIFKDGDVVENLSANPEIEISHCECGNNRPRGFLLSSPKKTLVEQCIFYNMYQGIHIGGGIGGWYESGAVKDVIIRNNQFRNSAFAGGVAINIEPEFENVENMRHFSRGIVVEDNVFVQSEKRLMKAHASDHLIFKNNRFICDESLPFYEKEGKEGVTFTNCEDVKYEPVAEQGIYEQIQKNTVKATNQLKDSEYVSFENPNGKGIRILFLGNSITRHGIASEIGWNQDCGMAASSKEKDYVHCIMKKMSAVKDDNAYCICQVSKWEREYQEGTEKLYATYEEARNFQADIIIQRCIENCSFADWNKEVFLEELDKLLMYVNPSGKAKIIMTTSFWNHVGDEALREYAEKHKFPLIELGDLGEKTEMKAEGLFAHEGVASHPGDLGMKTIAERIWDVMSSL